MSWIKMHLTLSAVFYAVGVWIVLASLLARKVAKPSAPRWKVVLYTIIIDAPAFVAAHNGEIGGVLLQLFGAKIAVPFASLTKVTVTPSPSPSPSATGSGGAPPTIALLLFAALGASACATDPMVDYYRGTTSAAIAVQGGRRALDTFDKKALADIAGELAPPAVKTAHLDAWLARYDVAAKAFDGLWAVVKGAVAAAPIVALAVDKSKQVADWLAKLAAAGLQVPKILSDAGVKL